MRGRVPTTSVLRRIPPYTEEMLNPSVFPPYSGIPSVFGQFWPFLAIFFGHFLAIFDIADSGEEQNPPFFGSFS